MKLGDGVEAAVHCAAMMVGLEGTAVLPAQALAEYHGLKPSYLVKHLQAMVGAGILASVPGPAGGYRLARPADAVTLLDIVLAVEGAEPAFRCGEIRQRGPGALPAECFRQACGINRAMLKAERAYRAALAEVTLAEIVTGFLAESDQRSIARGAAFVAANRRGAA
ncbi:RrF2 family transcriptional regulator [Solirhodobacter olei]|uniref:RrF2 family transcriptional regulator n=1 Tax=Solirhodobacter olei TaxID=2493082 RepID=UPI000FDAF05D|nr:Rrf2 family transcriptional regulator [Solirhodobacter olei]